MKKRAEIKSKEILFIGIISLIFCLGLVFAGSFTSVVTPNTVNESVSGTYNFTINNTASDKNLTQVKIILPSTGGFSFTFGSNGTSASNTNFTNTSSVLTWTNTTVSGFVLNQTSQYFWINSTATKPGSYNFTVNVTDTAGVVNTTNVAVTINDTTAPNYTAFVGPGLTASANLSQSSIPINISATDNGVIDSIVIRLYNSTRNQINSSTNSSGVSSWFFNFTGLAQGTYYVNASVNDTYNNVNNTATLTITLDTTYPLIDYGTGTENNAVNVSRSNVYVNVSVTETNEKNITFLLFNSTGQVNSTTYTDGTRTINWTGLSNGVYTYNVTVYDYAGNKNSTGTRTITLDTTYSLISYGTNTEVDNYNASRTWIYVNVTFTETNFANITFTLKNDTGTVNTTTFTTATYTINWTSLPNNNYTYYVNITDSANNKNSTGTKLITLDTVAPSITFSCSPTTLTASGTVTCSCSASDVTSGVKDSPSFTINPTVSYGTHTTTCTAGDYAGNNASATQTYTVSGGSPSSSGGGSSSITKTYIPSDAKVKSGYTQELKSNERVKLTIASKTHYVAVTALTTTSATISVSSTPQTATLNIGETKKFDVTGDGYYDLSAKLNAIKNNKADITIKSIYEKISAEPSAPAPSETVPETTTKTTGLPEEAPNLTWLWIIIGVIVVLIVIAIIYKYKKK